MNYGIWTWSNSILRPDCTQLCPQNNLPTPNPKAKDSSEYPTAQRGVVVNSLGGPTWPRTPQILSINSNHNNPGKPLNSAAVNQLPKSDL